MPAQVAVSAAAARVALPTTRGSEVPSAPRMGMDHWQDRFELLVLKVGSLSEF